MHPLEVSNDLRDILSDHRRNLEVVCRDMLAWASREETHAREAGWPALEAELLDHLAAEEEVILPAYSLASPEDAHRIRADHARIRALVANVDVAAQRHEVRAGLQPLIAAIGANALAEDAAMYPWAAQHLAMVPQRLLFARVGRAVGREAAAGA